MAGGDSCLLGLLGGRLSYARKPMVHGELWVTSLLGFDAVAQQSCCRAGEEIEV